MWIAIGVAIGIILLLTIISKNKAPIVIPPNAYLVDVRKPAEFSAGSVPGAVNIPLNEINARKEEFRDKKNIVFFCKTGTRSGQAKMILDHNGFENVVNGGSVKKVRELMAKSEVIN